METISKDTVCERHIEFLDIEEESNEDMKQYLARFRRTWRNPSFSTITKLKKGFRAVFDGRIDMDSEWNKQILDVFKKEFGIDTDNLQVSTSREKTYIEGYDNQDSEIKKWSLLHSDYYENPNYVYTAILYLETSENLVGGETGFIDECPIGKKGLIVEPKFGRLVIFTGGGNYHSPLKVYKGFRKTYHVWFR